MYCGSVTAVSRETRVGHSALAALLVIALLIAAFRLNDPVCHRAHRRAVAARHSLLTRQVGPTGDGSWYAEPRTTIDLAFPDSEWPASTIRRILKAHRIALDPVPTRRPKLPPSHSDPF